MDYTTTTNYSDVSGAAGTAAGGAVGAMILGFIAAYLVFILLIYFYYAVCLMKIANKTGTPNGWLAWIPIANVVLMLQVAKKPIWWIILFFIPLVNLVIMIIVWMAIAEAVGKPSWWGVLLIVPVVNLIVPGYLAFSRGGNETSSAPPANSV